MSDTYTAICDECGEKMPPSPAFGAGLAALKRHRDETGHRVLRDEPS